MLYYVTTALTTRRYPSNLVKYEKCNNQAETAFQILSVVDRGPIIRRLTNTIVDSDQCADQTSQCKHTTSIKLYNQHTIIRAEVKSVLSPLNT